MGEFVDKVKGSANEAIGRTKVEIGEQTDNPELVLKGAAQEMKGKTQSAIGTVKGKLGNKM